MKIANALGLVLVASATFSASADELDRTCGSYRQSLSEARAACARIKLQLDRSLCTKEREIPASDAYSACIRSFNERGAAKTREKIERGRQQQRQP